MWLSRKMLPDFLLKFRPTLIRLSHTPEGIFEASLGRFALNEVGVAVLDTDRVIRPLPTRRFKQVTAAAISGLKDVAVVTTPAPFGENEEVNSFASIS